ncbi:uncharacterized protein M421DRAFT_17123, partial [Didymella exigua CBS 183.55]
MLDKLRILQVNLNKSAQATESALQSPLDYLDTCSVNHPSFTQILPLLQDYSIRPRVLVYSARTIQAQVTILTDTSPDPDFLAITVKSSRTTFSIYNVYNQLDTQGITTIERKLLSTSILPSAILLGDFNINHPWWDP